MPVRVLIFTGCEVASSAVGQPKVESRWSIFSRITSTLFPHVLPDQELRARVDCGAYYVQPDIITAEHIGGFNKLVRSGRKSERKKRQESAAPFTSLSTFETNSPPALTTLVPKKNSVLGSWLRTRYFFFLSFSVISLARKENISHFCRTVWLQGSLHLLVSSH